MRNISDKFHFFLFHQSQKFYKSTSEYISQDYRLVDHEIDATVINDVDDIFYLTEIINPRDWDIFIALGNLMLERVALVDFIHLITGREL